MTEPATVTGALGNDHGYGPDIDHVLLTEQQMDVVTAVADQNQLVGWLAARAGCEAAESLGVATAARPGATALSQPA